MPDLAEIAPMLLIDFVDRKKRVSDSNINYLSFLNRSLHNVMHCPMGCIYYEPERWVGYVYTGYSSTFNPTAYRGACY